MLIQPDVCIQDNLIAQSSRIFLSSWLWRLQVDLVSCRKSLTLVSQADVNLLRDQLGTGALIGTKLSRTLPHEFVKPFVTMLQVSTLK